MGATLRRLAFFIYFVTYFLEGWIRLPFSVEAFEVFDFIELPSSNSLIRACSFKIRASFS